MGRVGRGNVVVGRAQLTKDGTGTDQALGTTSGTRTGCGVKVVAGGTGGATLTVRNHVAVNAAETIGGSCTCHAWRLAG